MKNISATFLIAKGFIKDSTRNTRWFYKGIGGSLGIENNGTCIFYFFGSNLRIEFEEDLLFIIGLIEYKPK